MSVWEIHVLILILVMLNQITANFIMIDGEICDIMYTVKTPSYYVLTLGPTSVCDYTVWHSEDSLWYSSPINIPTDCSNSDPCDPITLTKAVELLQLNPSRNFLLPSASTPSFDVYASIGERYKVQRGTPWTLGSDDIKGYMTTMGPLTSSIINSCGSSIRVVLNGPLTPLNLQHEMCVDTTCYPLNISGLIEPAILTPDVRVPFDLVKTRAGYQIIGGPNCSLSDVNGGWCDGEIISETSRLISMPNLYGVFLKNDALYNKLVITGHNDVHECIPGSGISSDVSNSWNYVTTADYGWLINHSNRTECLNVATPEAEDIDSAEESSTLDLSPLIQLMSVVVIVTLLPLLGFWCGRKTGRSTKKVSRSSQQELTKV